MKKTRQVLAGLAGALALAGGSLVLPSTANAYCLPYIGCDRVPFVPGQGSAPGMGNQSLAKGQVK